MERYSFDDKAGALQVVGFWKAGTASKGESALLDVLANCDLNIRERMRREFPALVWAFEVVCLGQCTRSTRSGHRGSRA